MIELRLAGHDRARVWMGELPLLRLPFARLAQRTVNGRPGEAGEKRLAALELLLPRGGHCPYGLLGAEFVPSRAASLLIEAWVSPDDGAGVEWSLARVIDEVHSGLPEEYVDAVFDGAMEAGRYFGGGTLCYSRAAHGAIGSSVMVFRRLQHPL